MGDAYPYSEPVQYAPARCFIPGTKRVKYLEENAAATGIKLSAGELERLNSVFENGEAGCRYPDERMRSLNG